MHFEQLALKHAVPLLAFEVQNRAFFDTLIAPRDAGFYSKQGIENHINSLVDKQDSRAYILVEDKYIIARANIRNIVAEGRAEIGYRVSQHKLGQGIGSRCVQHLVQQAKALNLIQLIAFVMDNNPASEKVLAKNGFELSLCLPNKFVHHGQCLHGFQYHRSLD